MSSFFGVSDSGAQAYLTLLKLIRLLVSLEDLENAIWFSNLPFDMLANGYLAGLSLFGDVCSV